MVSSSARYSMPEALVERIRASMVGELELVPGPYGPRPLVYADYAASGRAVALVEDYVWRMVLPSYANTHTEASFCGATTSRLRALARRKVAKAVGAGAEDAVIFTGSGATAAVNKLIALLGLRDPSGQAEGRAVVFLGPYEHHSNILPWRESAAKVVEIPEGPDGGPCLRTLANELDAHCGWALKMGSFSAASNVTGIRTDVGEVTRLLHMYGAMAFWDYAAAGPYVPIDMNPGDPATAMDAIFLSPHKFVGGVGASGVLVMKRSLATLDIPTTPGGGTVSYVSSSFHDYASDLVTREEGGTPNILGDIRAALAFELKDAVGTDYILEREHVLEQRALQCWRENPAIEILGPDDCLRVPIFSFRVHRPTSGYYHHQFVTRALSDIFGVQARGGCACAGPYAHRLLAIDENAAAQVRADIAAGNELEKPGWVRLNFSYIMADETADYIIDAVDWLASNMGLFERDYLGDPSTARFRHCGEEPVEFDDWPEKAGLLTGDYHLAFPQKTDSLSEFFAFQSRKLANAQQLGKAS